jgi:hypothetical protein
VNALKQRHRCRFATPCDRPAATIRTWRTSRPVK